MPVRDQFAVGQRVSPPNAAQRVQEDVLVVGAELGCVARGGLPYRSLGEQRILIRIAVEHGVALN